MTRLKVPSLQHLARLSKPDASRVSKGLLSLLDNTPTFSYEPLYLLIRDLVVLKIPYEQLEEAICRKGYREDVQKRFLEILPLVRDFFKKYDVSFANSVLPRYYLVDRDLDVPFSPPMIFGANGKIIFPWFIFWKDNPLSGESLSLFVTLVKEILADDSDLEDADFLIVDLSYDKDEQARTLKVTHAGDVPLLAHARKVHLLSIFAEGFRQARTIAARRLSKEKSPVNEKDLNQPDLI